MMRASVAIEQRANPHAAGSLASQPVGNVDQTQSAANDIRHQHDVSAGNRSPQRSPDSHSLVVIAVRVAGDHQMVGRNATLVLIERGSEIPEKLANASSHPDKVQGCGPPAYDGVVRRWL